ncbi:MAG: hypothetical protein C0424_07625 [Sphingobacteriaceae bacterium]|nr:hypothetical protein [Sphingobacteriaceae bacterium]
MAAIRLAEANTSGEIRVHIEDYSRSDVLARTRYLFTKLGMHQTVAHNGVLIYVAVKDHQVAIFGDAGIDAVVEPDFWELEIALLIEYFKKGDYIGGLELAIAKVGEKLKVYFPHQGEADQNELSDEISMG